MEIKKNIHKSKAKNEFVTAVAANTEGEIIEIEGFAAMGMAGSDFVPLTKNNTIDMPFGGEFMFLPDRIPIVYNIAAGRFEALTENPYVSGEKIMPVAAFNSPGYTISYISAYKEDDNAVFLPLFSYGAVGWSHGGFRSAAILVDRERRQDLRLMQQDKVVSGVRKMRKKMPGNRLRAHLEKCALEYGCPAGKNFFLGRYEAPLPTSQHCNARCLGCISLQEDSKLKSSQNRITFTPTPEEIAAVALEHIKKVDKSIVSFGQGCEGDPLLAADVIEKAIKIIRSETKRGTININTNGSLPDIINHLFDAGLDSIRISLNSVRSKCYDAYFRPKGYSFSHVKKSIDIAAARGKFVSINYLNCPGFTDTPEEVEALILFIKKHGLNMIQWRNLNFDPLRYLDIMNKTARHSKPAGMQTTFKKIKKAFPKLKHGYFNPSKENFSL